MKVLQRAGFGHPGAFGAIHSKTVVYRPISGEWGVKLQAQFENLIFLPIYNIHFTTIMR
jgi:hypothetical protein